jgi:integrase
VGRKRNKRNSLLPKYVEEKRGAWVYKPYLGRENGRTKWGTPVRLCSTTAPMSELFAAYERATGESRGTLRWMLKAYHASAQFEKLKPRTRRDYEAYRRLVCQRKGAEGQSFGDAPLGSISKRTIRRYLDTYGAPVAANRHIQYLKAAWNWAEQRYRVPANPCAGVTLNEERPRTRLVEDEEYIEFAIFAGGYVELFMGLAYLTRARWGEIARFTTDDLTDEGLRLHRGKGSENEITAWSPMLRRVVKACLEYNADAPTPIRGGRPLIRTKAGKAINQNTFQTAWGRKQRAWAKLGRERFTFHDLKAMGITAQQDHYGGHRSDRMRKVYVRKAKLVQPPA